MSFFLSHALHHMHAMLHVISMQTSSSPINTNQTLHFTLHSKPNTRKSYTTKMANKLFLVSATLAFFFLLANASIYRTVVEFDGEEDDTNPGPFGPQQKCRKEFQQEQHLRACQRWMRKQMRRSPRDDLDVDDELDFDEDDDMENRRQGSRPPLLQRCCSELREEDPICVCPTLKQAAKAVRLQGPQHGPMQVRRIFQTAKHLPKACNMQQVGVCPFKAAPFFPPYY